MIPSIISINGDLYLNQVRNFVKGCVIAPRSTSIPVVVAQGAQSPPIILEAPTDGAAEIFSLMGQQDASVASGCTNRFTVTLNETFRGNRQLMNLPILCNHVFGTPGNPFFLCESLFLEPGQTLQAIFRNPAGSGGSSSFRFGMEARKLQTTNVANKNVQNLIQVNRNEKNRFYPYWLTNDSAISLAQSAKGVAYFTNTLDQWLLIQYAMATAITTGVEGDTTELFTCELFDPRTDRPLQNQPFTLNTGFGDAQFPYVFPTPWLIEPQSQIKANLANLVTDASTEIYITFHGVAAYAHELPSEMKRIYQSQQLQPIVWNR
jgi:hypothetical protein